MKEVTNYYNNQDILFKQIKEIFPKELGSRKKLRIFTATSIKSEYYAIFIINSKSRFIRKNASDLLLMEDQLASYVNHSFKRKELIISSPICSKAKKFLENEKWRIKVDFV